MTHLFTDLKPTAKDILSLLSSGISTASQKAILGQSVYYYCSGIDPTPVSVFGCAPALYVYVDKLVAIHRDFAESLTALCHRIAQLGYVLKETFPLKNIPLLSGAERAALCSFSSGDDQFFLLFVQSDAENAFTHLYGHDANYIQPLCVCNFRYESSGHTLRTLEKRVAYILGHAFGEKYRPVGEYPYLGDYGGKGQNVTLYRRTHYYLF